MKASEARRIAEEALSGDAIAAILTAIYGRVEDVARLGKKSLNHPFSDIRRDEQYLIPAIKKALAADGYTIESHGGSDQRDPAWDELKW